MFSKVSHDCMLYTQLVAQPSLTHPTHGESALQTPSHALPLSSASCAFVFTTSTMDYVCCTDCTVQAVQPPTPSSPVVQNSFAVHGAACTAAKLSYSTHCCSCCSCCSCCCCVGFLLPVWPYRCSRIRTYVGCVYVGSYTVNATTSNGKLVVLTARVKPAWSVHTYIHTYV